MELKPITRHAMGMQMELGTLFDARSSTFYSSYSLWNLEDIKNHQRVTEAPDTKFSFSSSLKDTRKNSGLDVEGSVGVDFGIFELSGSAKYLEDKRQNSNEARVDVTCTRVNQTRAIPMEVMTKGTYNDLVLSSPEITHFVSEVKEGAVGNITFIKKCRSADEVKEISGSLAGKLKHTMAMEGKLELEWKEGEKDRYEDVQIYVEGGITEAVTNVDDAARVGKKLPETLSNINNTLTMTLLPISKLDSNAKRLVRKLDEDLLLKVSNMLAKAKIAYAEVSELQELTHMEKFPKIKDQCAGFQEAFYRYISSFKQKVGETLPSLKDGSEEETGFLHKLERVVMIMRQQVNVAKKFVSIKTDEGQVLTDTVKNLEGKGLKNYLKESRAFVAGNDSHQVMLNLYVAQSRQHRLEKQLAEISKQTEEKDETDSDEDEDEGEEWFQDDQTNLHKACNQIRECFTKNTNANVEFGFCSVARAYSVDGSEKKAKTCIGDVLLKSEGKVQVCETNLANALSHLITHVVTVDEPPQQKPRVFFEFWQENRCLARLVIQLNNVDAPNNCKSFLRLIRSEPGYGYNGTKVNCVRTGFGFAVGFSLLKDAESRGLPVDEFEVPPENLSAKHDRGVLSMWVWRGTTFAGFRIHSQPDAQWDGKGVIIGHVTEETLSEIDAVMKVPVDSFNAPQQDIIITCGVS